MTALVVVAWIRMDFLAACLIIWLFVFAILPQSKCRNLWPIFLIYLTILFPLQYLMAIGLPVEWCIGNFCIFFQAEFHCKILDYPWNNLLEDIKLDENLSIFLGLANNRLKSKRFRENIIADFFLLIIAASQVFL